MNKLIKGTLTMTNVANKDIDMYIKSGWKLDSTTKDLKPKRKQKDIFDKENMKVEDENDIDSNLIKE